MKVKNWIKISLLCALLAVGLCLSAQGAEETGSVTLQLPAAADGIEMTAYLVAQFENGNFVYNDDFAESNLMIEDLGDTAEAQRAAQQLAEYAQKQGISGVSKTADKSGSLKFTDLTPALYLVAQTKGAETLQVQPAIVPVPYASAGGQEWIYDAVIAPKYSFAGGAVIAHKVDEEGHLVGAAEFALQQKIYVTDNSLIPADAEAGADEGGSFYWKEFKTGLVSSEKGQVVLTDMPAGSYRLIETKAPAGFILEGGPYYFTIDKAGQVKEIGGTYAAASGKVEELTVVNRQTTVKVNKVDKNGKPVPGAKLVIKAVDGKLARADSNTDGSVFTFVTTEEPYELKRLPAGNYLLSEVEAPEGYHVSKDVPFTVEDGVDSVNEVTMIDEKEEKTKISLSVTKTLVDQHEMELSAEEDTFYVALFEDAERTKKVSNVQAIHFAGSSSETVTFSNLEADKTYYVGETDEFGVSMDVVSADEGVYAPVYPGDNYKITPTKKDAHKEYAFQNMFYDLPTGYTYVGHLTVTKKVLKGTEPYNTDQTFYAALFKDKECTQREGEVIALPMEGGSETSVTVTVDLGKDASNSVTYYVAEIDENGKVLNAASGLECEVFVDKTEITMSPEQSREEVTITNTYPDETEPETPKHPGGNTPTGDTPSGGTSSTAAKTGDSTQVMPYMILLILAAVIAAGAVSVRRRKKTR